MSRYIDADALFDLIDDCVCAMYEDAREVKDEVLRIIADERGADVEPVRHGHWILEAKHLFDDYGDCIVYVIAKCSNCGKHWHNGHTVWSEILSDYDYSTDMPDQITERRINDAKQRCLQDAKEAVKEYVSCELCGAKMEREYKK